MSAFQTDLYQFTMAAGYFAAGKVNDVGVFELFVRRLPPQRDYLIAVGLQQAVDYLLNLAFTQEHISYLKSLAQFANAQPAFWDYLLAFRFSGDLFAMPEGTPFFAGEPIVTVRAPIIEAQLAETYLLSTLGFQSMIAAKAARIVAVAQGRAVVEFGTRRAHGPEAGVLAGRAAYIGGCIGTSNVEAGMRFQIPLFGTSAHSWVLAFAEETEAFRALQQLLGRGTVYLIDTYDTVEGARRAVGLGPPLWGVRLDSGDLVELSREVRKILDDAGFHEAKVMATSDLNEYRIAELLSAGAPIDVFGVGTDLATSSDAPAVSAVYKLVELESEGTRRYTAKYSPEKQTLPGAKQVFRFPTKDIVGGNTECTPGSRADGPAEALLRPVILGGQLAEALPSATQARTWCAAALQKIAGSNHQIRYSDELLQRADEHNRTFHQ
ncbi:MAG: nicotinate phosphoribosyltransferase [Bryobacteraceae bacterium]|nr:nicotinate phosphoribosyltransferase [Bryobacteraceae bacterium]